MTKEQLVILEKTLDKYCRKHLARGGTLIRGRYRTDNALECCPIQASIVLHNAPKQNWLDWLFNLVRLLFGKPPLPVLSVQDTIRSYYEALSEVVGFPISHREAISITHGFDSHINYNPSLDLVEQELFMLGRRLAEKYHPVAIP